MKNNEDKVETRIAGEDSVNKIDLIEVNMDAERIKNLPTPL